MEKSDSYITLYIHGEIEQTVNKNSKITITKNEAVRICYQLITVILLELKRDLMVPIAKSLAAETKDG